MRMLMKGDFVEGELYPAGSIVRMPAGNYLVRTYRESWEPVAAPVDPSCQGLPGRDGRHGIDGKNGRDGERGADGRDGVDGKDGKRGKRGPAGAEGAVYQQYMRRTVLGEAAILANFDTPATRGQVVRITGDGHVDLAIATSDAAALAVGLADGNGGYVTHGPFTSDTWNLTPNTFYYLSPSVPGEITATFPDSIGSRVVKIGMAATPKTLIINIDYAGEIGT